MPFSALNQQNRDVLLAIIDEAQQLITPFTDGLTHQHQRLQLLRDRLTGDAVALRVCVVARRGAGKSSLLNALFGAEVLPCNDHAAGDPRACDAETSFDLPIRCAEPGNDDAEPLLLGPRGERLAVGADGVRDWLRLENLQQRDGVARRELETQRAMDEVRARQEQGAAAERPPPGGAADGAGAEAAAPPATLRVTPLCYDGGFTELPVTLVDTARGRRPARTVSAPRSARVHTTATHFAGDAFVYAIDYRDLRTDEEVGLLEGLLDPARPELIPSMAERLVFVVTHADPLINRVHNIDNIHRTERDAELADRFASVDDLRSYVTKLLRPAVGELRPAQVAVVATPLALYARLVQPRAGGAAPPLRAVYDYCELSRGSAYMQQIDGIPEAELREKAAAHGQGRMADSGIHGAEEALQLLALNSGALVLSGVCGEAAHAVADFNHVLLQAGPIIAKERGVDDEELAQLRKELEFVDARSAQVRQCISAMRSEIEAVIRDGFRDFWADRVGELSRIISGEGTECFKARQETAVSDVMRCARRLHGFLPRYEHDRRYMEGKLAVLQREGPAPAEDTQWEFVERNVTPILASLARELREHVHDVGLAFMHHVKDELQLFLPALIALCQERRRELLRQLHACAGDVCDHTARRTGQALCVDDASAEWVAAPIAAPDDRAINNFLRDLPEEAVDVLVRAADAPGIRALAAEECAARTAQTVAESWNVVLERAAAGDVVTYDRDRVTALLQEMQDRIDDVVGAYRGSLQEGVRQQEEALDESRLQEAEVDEQRRELQPLLQELQQLWESVKDGVVWDRDTAAALAEEEQMRQGEEGGKERGARGGEPAPAEVPPAP